MNQITTTNGKNKAALPDNLPAGAKAFQKAVDGKLTIDVWAAILEAQIAKAKDGNLIAAKFLLEYAGGVASMRGATFIQENHYHDGLPASPDEKSDAVDGVATRTADDWEAGRELRAQQAARRVSA